MTFKKGDKVKPTKKWAEWMFEHLFESCVNSRTGEIPAGSNYDNLMQLAMLVTMGCPIVGTVIHVYSFSYDISFGRYGSELIEGADLMPEHMVEVEVELTSKTAKLISKLAKSTGLSTEQCLSVLVTAGALSNGY